MVQVHSGAPNGALVQLARTLPLQGRGRGFDSHTLHHLCPLTQVGEEVSLLMK